MTNTHCFLDVDSKASIRLSKLNCIRNSPAFTDGNDVTLNTGGLGSNSLLWIVAEMYPALIQTSKMDRSTMVVHYF